MIGKYFTILTVFLLLISPAYADFNPLSPWHQIQQISGDNGITSVDSDSNGIIDFSNKSNACNSDSVCETTGLTSTTNTYLATNSGRVGIGTTNPSNKLDVLGNFGAYNIFSSSGNPGISVNETDASENNHIWLLAANDEKFYLQAINDSGAGGGYGFWFNRIAQQITALNFGYATSPLFIANATSDKVGIGTASPTQKLHVQGNLNVTGSIYTSENSVYLGNKALSNDAGTLKWGGSAIGGSGVLGFNQWGTSALISSSTYADSPVFTYPEGTSYIEYEMSIMSAGSTSIFGENRGYIKVNPFEIHYTALGEWNCAASPTQALQYDAINPSLPYQIGTSVLKTQCLSWHVYAQLLSFNTGTRQFQLRFRTTETINANRGIAVKFTYY